MQIKAIGARAAPPVAKALSSLRDADWLNAERARAWSMILAITTFSVAAVWIAMSQHGIDRLGKPLGTDFVSFWTASQLALSGDAYGAYDPQIHAAAQRAVVQSGNAYYGFFYPPVFLLLCLPLALLPYLASLTAWMVGGLVLLLTCLRRILPQRWAIVPMLAFPGVSENVGHGQNAFISASCFGGGMLLLERYPLFAGLCLGGLIFKPQLAIAVPVALVAARRWSAVASAAISAIGLCILSYLILGQEAWRGFAHASALARLTLENGMIDPAKMQSLYAAVRVLHGSSAIGYAAQVVLALSSAILLAKTAARRPGGTAEGALLVASSLLCTPFLLDYDLVCLALPMAWVMAKAQKTGWRPWEKIVLLAAYVLPMLSRLLAMEAGIPIGPLAMVCLLLIVWRRAGCPATSGIEEHANPWG
jgi:alpha-1,2-mannosyltransferase